MKAVGKAVLIASAIALVLAVGTLMYFFANFRLGSRGSPAPASAAPASAASLTEEARQRLNAEAAWLLPTLEQVRTSGGDLTADSVRHALVAAGYRDQDVAAAYRPTSADGTRHVAFGIEFRDGCVSGVVSATEVDAQATGQTPGRGCLPPETH